MRIISWGIICLLGVASTALADPVPAAPPILKISVDGGASLEIMDGGVGDLNPTTGVVAYSGPLDMFFVTFEMGQSSEPLSTKDFPFMDLVVAVTDGISGNGKITIEFTDVNFQGGTPALPTAGFQAFWSPVTDGVTSAQLWRGDGATANDAFAKDVLLLDLGTVASPGGFVHEQTSTPSLPDPYSLTMVWTIDHSALTGIHTTTGNFKVEANPEPGTLATIGLAAIGAIVVLRRRKKNSAA
ncbi:MAG: PEP-CTERM sorting domain-containing protein [Planctomycetota bacterium]|jgi:hypothetical protein